MIRCDFSNAPDCSECNEPICRRGHSHMPNDWDDDNYGSDEYEEGR